MAMTTRPTLLLKKLDVVWVKGEWIKGIVRGHNWDTNRYMVELPSTSLNHNQRRFIYRNRDEIIKVGGD